MNNTTLFLVMGMGLFCGYAWGAASDNPGDLNGDLRVDVADFAILAENWLRDYTPPTELPPLEVVSAGITQKAVQVLADVLGLDPTKITIENGVASYLDKTRFQWVPTNPVIDPLIINRLRRGTDMDYKDTTLLFRSFDVAAINAMRPIPDDDALKLTSAALRKARLLPELAKPSFHHNVFTLVNRAENATVAEATLDTQVNYDWAVNNIPVVGPGAKLCVTFDTQGNVTQMLYSARTLRSGEGLIPIASPLAAVRKYIDPKALDSNPIDARLVYYAPPLAQGNAQVLLPYYDVGGTYWGPQGHSADQLRRFVPATVDPHWVPQVKLDVSVSGNLITATATVYGGQAPYSYRWVSSSVDPDMITVNNTTATYQAMPRNTLDETISVVVTDTNGTEMTASETVQVAESTSGYPPAGGISYGTERAVSDMCAANQWDFINAFNSAGVKAEFNYSGQDVWEYDFKYNSEKQELVDSADLVFYLGHGNSGGFTFETQKGDDYLYYPDAHLTWGNKDMEWLCLLSCNVLAGSPAQTWGWTFDGLHLLCGFSTYAYDNPGFGKTFAQSMLANPALPIRAAWFKAYDVSQPSYASARVMGPVGPGGCYSGYDDYFWGKGPVSPDITGADVNELWWITHN